MNLLEQRLIGCKHQRDLYYGFKFGRKSRNWSGLELGKVADYTNLGWRFRARWS